MLCRTCVFQLPNVWLNYTVHLALVYENISVNLDLLKTSNWKHPSLKQMEAEVPRITIRIEKLMSQYRQISSLQEENKSQPWAENNQFSLNTLNLLKIKNTMKKKFHKAIINIFKLLLINSTVMQITLNKASKSMERKKIYKYVTSVAHSMKTLRLILQTFITGKTVLC